MAAIFCALRAGTSSPNTLNSNNKCTCEPFHHIMMSHTRADTSTNCAPAFTTSYTSRWRKRWYVGYGERTMKSEGFPSSS
eukprot:5218713-Amphidinium_carterae.2